MNMQKFEDFRLFVVEENDRERALDGDECMVDVLKIKEEKQSGFLRKIIRSFSEAFRERPKEILFKKYYYLHKSQEQNDYLSDFVRLNLLVSQTLREVKQTQYNFDYKDYLLLACLGTYNNYSDEIRSLGANEWFEKTKLKRILDFIPPLIVNTKSKDFWREATNSYWKKMLQEIDTMVVKNKNFIDEEKNTDQPHIRDIILKYKGITDPAVLVKHLILNVMWACPCYGVALYEAKVYQPDQEIGSRGWPKKRFLLGIKYGELQAYSMTRSKYYLSHRLSEIRKVNCFPNSIMLNFPDYQIRIDTKRSFEIVQLIRTYQSIEYIVDSVAASPQCI